MARYRFRYPVTCLGGLGCDFRLAGFQLRIRDQQLDGVIGNVNGDLVSILYVDHQSAGSCLPERHGRWTRHG